MPSSLRNWPVERGTELFRRNSSVICGDRQTHREADPKGQKDWPEKRTSCDSIFTSEPATRAKDHESLASTGAESAPIPPTVTNPAAALAGAFHSLSDTHFDDSPSHSVQRSSNHYRCIVRDPPVRILFSSHWAITAVPQVSATSLNV
jgi:hypothetical protein